MPAVDVNLISTVGRIRGLTESTVDALVDSIAEVGLLNPVTVYRKPITRSGLTVDGYGLVAGAHRLEACKRLGLAEIEVTIVDLDEPHRVLAECDENLCGTTLTPVERAEFTAKRKWAYEKLHPETVNGATGNGREKVRQLGEATPDNEIKRFTADTAAKTGQSERKVQRDAERGEKVCISVLAMVKGTHLDKGKYLDQLKDMTPEEQVQRVKEDLARRDPVKDKRKSKIDADVKDRAIMAVAELLAERTRPDELDGLKADLYAAADARKIADALSSIVGNSLPYRGAA